MMRYTNPAGVASAGFVTGCIRDSIGSVVAQSDMYAADQRADHVVQQRDDGGKERHQHDADDRQDGDHRQYRGQAEHAGQVQAVGGQTGGRDDIVQLVEHADRVKQQIEEVIYLLLEQWKKRQEGEKDGEHNKI